MAAPTTERLILLQPSNCSEPPSPSSRGAEGDVAIHHLWNVESGLSGLPRRLQRLAMTGVVNRYKIHHKTSLSGLVLLLVSLSFIESSCAFYSF